MADQIPSSGYVVSTGKVAASIDADGKIVESPIERRDGCLAVELTWRKAART